MRKRIGKIFLEISEKKNIGKNKKKVLRKNFFFFFFLLRKRMRRTKNLTNEFEDPESYKKGIFEAIDFFSQIKLS